MFSVAQSKKNEFLFEDESEVFNTFSSAVYRNEFMFEDGSEVFNAFSSAVYKNKFMFEDGRMLSVAQSTEMIYV